jgi:peptide subunit release factor 1 (eRF1)
MTKQRMREEAERLVREAMEKKAISITKGDTRIDAKCGKCGTVNKVSAAPGETRPKYKCKECGQQQNAL